MPSKEIEVVKNLYRNWTQARLAQTDPSKEAPSAEDTRWENLTTEPPEVKYSEVDAGGVPAMWVTPAGATEDRVLLAIHGGGFVGGSIQTHRKLFGHLAKAVDARALIVEYRLAPKYTHPAQLNDTTTAYNWLLDQGIRGEHIAFVGDSAGGGLCVTTTLRAREQNRPAPAGLMLISPWVDMEVNSETMISNHEKEEYFYQDLVKELVSIFLGKDGDPKDPFVNPLYADMTGLPPMYIHVGGDETLLDDSRQLAALAEKAGVEVQLDVFDELHHTFHMAAGNAPEADDAIERFASWIRPKLGLAI